MKILIDIGHPAHVHLFRFFTLEMTKKGHRILFTYRDKEFESKLLNAFGFDCIRIGKHYKGNFGKLWGLFRYDIRLWYIARTFKPDFFLSHGSIYASHVAWIRRKPHIALEDSGNMEQIRLYKPFTSVILCPEVLPLKLGKKEIRYNSYHELFYLHPDYYAPNKSILNLLKIKEGEPYVLVRFVSFKATHDIGHGGLTPAQKLSLISHLSNTMKVFISSESKLPVELDKYQLDVPPERIHDVLYFATLVISEGATIASESGVLGTPALYINNLTRAYIVDQEKYGLVYNLGINENIFEAIKLTISKLPDAEAISAGRNKLLKEKINPTKLLIWFFENWPDSKKEAVHY